MKAIQSLATDSFKRTKVTVNMNSIIVHCIGCLPIDCKSGNQSEKSFWITNVINGNHE